MKIIKDNLGKVAITCNGYWDKALPYDRLCIVITSLKADNISTFISRKPVPAGIDITNEEYWMRLGNSINFKTINGKSILGEGDIFIDTSLYRIVNELPTDNIEEKIYVLISYGSEIDNDHTEWVYIDNQWEKLGDSTFVRFEDLGIEATDELSRNELKRFVTNGRSVGTINTIDVTKGENGNINISGKKSSRGGGYHDYYSLRDYSIEIPVVSDTNNGLVPKLPSDFGSYFPISRINPNSVDSSTDWYSFEEPSVYNRDDEGPLNTVNIELSVCKAGSDINNVLWDISIPAVSSNGAGVMTANDKTKLDDIEEGAQVNTIESITFKDIPVELIDKTIKLNTYMVYGNEANFSLSYRTSETNPAGVPIYKPLYGLSTNGKYIKFYNSNEDSSMLIDLSDTTKQAIDNAIKSVSVNGTPLEVTDKGVDIPIHEYTAGDGIKLENGKFSLDPVYDAGYGAVWGGDLGCYFPIYTDGTLYNKIAIHNIAHRDDGFGKLGLLSKSDYNAFNAKQDALTEAQLNNINNAITSISVNDAEQINTNGIVNLTIPNATPSKTGLMSADDKTKLDSITNDSLLPNTDDVAEGVSILTVGKTNHAGSTQTSIEWSKLSVGRNGYEINIKGGNASKNTIITLPPATDNEAGLLPAYLYTPLNNKQAIISNLKLSNDTDNTTSSDYIVLTRADYQSILDRLATLENK